MIFDFEEDGFKESSACSSPETSPHYQTMAEKRPYLRLATCSNPSCDCPLLPFFVSLVYNICSYSSLSMYERCSANKELTNSIICWRHRRIFTRLNGCCCHVEAWIFSEKHQALEGQVDLFLEVLARYSLLGNVGIGGLWAATVKDVLANRLYIQL